MHMCICNADEDSDSSGYRPRDFDAQDSGDRCMHHIVAISETASPISETCVLC